MEKRLLIKEYALIVPNRFRPRDTTIEWQRSEGIDHPYCRIQRNVYF